jgi:NADPH:quinone reductase-like Zn-dependent oxidoreductase
VKYKSVLATQRGGPEVLQVMENELRPPAAGEARIKVLAVGVGRTDLNYLHGYSPFSPKVPFVPGYEIVGVVEALCEGGNGLNIGDRVAALTGHGGYTEVICLGREHLVPVPASLDPAEVATLVLNYVTAWQMLHRTAKVKAGDKALFIGASGGVGTALLELGRLAGLKMYGSASSGKHKLLSEFGAVPIDYHAQDLVEVIHRAEPDGLDFVFDGIGGESGDRSMAVLRRGGKLIGYAPPTGFLPLLLGMFKLLFSHMRPDGRSAEFYGISAVYASNKKPFQEDLLLLLKLLEEGKIKPLIAARFPILEARKANELLDGGQVSGNIVLLAPVLL